MQINLSKVLKYSILYLCNNSQVRFRTQDTCIKLKWLKIHLPNCTGLINNSVQSTEFWTFEFIMKSILQFTHDEHYFMLFPPLERTRNAHISGTQFFFDEDEVTWRYKSSVTFCQTFLCHHQLKVKTRIAWWIFKFNDARNFYESNSTTRLGFNWKLKIDFIKKETILRDKKQTSMLLQYDIKVLFINKIVIK